MSDPIRILVADDHLIIRQGLRLILETAGGFRSGRGSCRWG